MCIRKTAELLVMDLDESTPTEVAEAIAVTSFHSLFGFEVGEIRRTN